MLGAKSGAPGPGVGTRGAGKTKIIKTKIILLTTTGFEHWSPRHESFMFTVLLRSGRQVVLPECVQLFIQQNGGVEGGDP